MGAPTPPPTTSSGYVIPGVGTMSSTALTDTQLSAILQVLFIQALGIDATQDPLAPSRVRIDWPVPGAPSWIITDDVLFIRAVEAPEPYNAAHEVQQITQFDNPGADGYGQPEPYTTGPYGGDEDGTYTEATIYTRAWDIYLIAYGPNAWDRIRQIKATLYQDWTADILAASNLYVIPVTGTPRRVPELYANQWWPRVDFGFRMYEQVADALSKPSMASADVIIIDPDGVAGGIVVS